VNLLSLRRRRIENDRAGNEGKAKVPLPIGARGHCGSPRADVAANAPRNRMFRKETDLRQALNQATLSCRISFGTSKPDVELHGCLLDWPNRRQNQQVRWHCGPGAGAGSRASGSLPRDWISLCHSINAAFDPAQSAPLSGLLSLPRYLCWFGLQPTDERGRLWRGRKQETPRAKVTTSGDVAQPRPLTSHLEVGKTFFGASTTTYQSTESSLSRLV
jgi:hypothetical protein